MRCVGDARRLVVGLETALRVGLLDPETRLLSCFAVMPTYLDAREPGVIRDSIEGPRTGVAAGRAVEIGFERVVLSPPPGVRLPLDAEGVILPPDNPGVTRPLDKESEGVLRPFALIEEDKEGVTLPDTDGVTRPLRIDATEDGRELDPTPVVGEESLEAAMKTPQFGGQKK